MSAHRIFDEVAKHSSEHEERLRYSRYLAGNQWSCFVVTLKAAELLDSDISSLIFFRLLLRFSL